MSQAKQFTVPSTGIEQDDTHRGADNPMLAALRAGQEERLQRATAYRVEVGDPIDVLTTLLPMPESVMSLLPVDIDPVEE